MLHGSTNIKFINVLKYSLNLFRMSRNILNSNMSRTNFGSVYTLLRIAAFPCFLNDLLNNWSGFLSVTCVQAAFINIFKPADKHI
jgi:hypothetical protein